MAQFLDLTGLGHFKDKNDALYAKQDGSYEGMTVGNAEQLVSTVGVEDNAPYTFRTTGGSADVGDRMNLKAVIGGTVAWNQLVQNGDFETTDGWTSNNASALSVSNHVGTFRATAYGGYLRNSSQDLIQGHKYFRSAYVNVSNTTDVTFNISGVVPIATKSQTGYQLICDVFTWTYPSGNYHIRVSDLRLSDWTDIQVKNIMIIDLTAMFGSAIADYAYTLESGTAGAGVAWLKKYGYFTKPYYPYKAAALESVKTSAHNTVGFNAYNPSTGKAKVVGGMTYQITGAYTALSLDGTSITPDANGYFTPSANGELTVTGGNSTTTCVHLKWDGERDGEYEPYEQHTYALDDVELRGIPKLDASNNLYYDGDRYLPDGTVTRRYGTYTFTGNESFIRFYARSNGEYYFTISGITGIKYSSSSTDKIGIVSNQYGVNMYSANEVYNSTLYGFYEGANSNEIRACLPNVIDAATAKTWFQNNPTTIVFELATPTTESADAYTELQICNDFGTEEFVDAATRDFDMPVCASAIYQPNLRAKLEMAPNSPSNGNGDYIVRQTDGVNEYVLFSEVKELPDLPTTDGTYTLKCTVADGTATLSWVSE